ncbi:MAG TPA: hypothetical protein VG798_02470 [Rhizomicrobium sp.]|nr:hypothetical protein [Rhizomicrobium sp.]
MKFSPVTFGIAFSLAYAVAFWFNQPLFLYYPLHGDVTLGPFGAAALKNAGPSMAWYGLMVDAGIAATILAFLIPGAAVERVFRNYLWLFPVAAMLVCVYLLRNLFLVS